MGTTLEGNCVCKNKKHRMSSQVCFVHIDKIHSKSHLRSQIKKSTSTHILHQSSISIVSIKRSQILPPDRVLGNYCEERNAFKKVEQEQTDQFKCPVTTLFGWSPEVLICCFLNNIEMTYHVVSVK